ncbi:hypothetical protein BDV37DRAFT_264800 [Aspergillus pseudonomiae]|uniref:Uncharacterized protein n=1 Tax=Aspergillus pseudonomiae TaxID=1506151 RepID=A0A5N7CUK8_9EURO|nr:uncharacterized protein BDV37DRAFT_264800 [Aspergillus pseudonomiae]KAE8397814.1 hypothetical protein BDV37DRAFT_264800 [Aspergillus pseudonomiae]
MTCFNDIFLQAIIPPWLRRFCFDRRSPVGLMDCDNGRQDDSQSRDSAVGHDEPQSRSSEYQTPRPLSYENEQPNLPAPAKHQNYSLFPKQSNPPSAPNIQRIKPASPTDLGEEAIAAIPETLRNDQAPTNGTKGTSTSRDSGEIIGLPESSLPEPVSRNCLRPWPEHADLTITCRNRHGVCLPCWMIRPRIKLDHSVIWVFFIILFKRRSCCFV